MNRLLLATLIAVATASEAAAAEDRYVSAGILNVRLCPSEDCPVTNRLYRGQKVEVFEEEGGWSRISEFYDSSAERMEFPEVTDDEVARWVASAYLSAAKPEDLEQPSFSDPRIQGIPKVGEYGLAEEDVRALRTYAAELLASGECSAIEYGDKSVTRPSTYYVLCEGESRNRFFQK